MNDMRRLKYRKKSAGGAFERLGLLRKHGINIDPEVLGAVATVPLDDLLATRPRARRRRRVPMPCRCPTHRRAATGSRSRSGTDLMVVTGPPGARPRITLCLRLWVEEDKLVATTVGSRTSNATVAIAKSGDPIAEKLVARMKREVRGKIVNLKRAIAGRAAAEEPQRTKVTKEGLAAFHPAHAAYVYAQNQVSVMSEQLTALEEMAPFADIVSKAEDLYGPSGPPMSPLTMSYFTCWAFFDACVEPTGETIGTTVLGVGAAFGMHTELLRLIRLMQESRKAERHGCA